MFFFVELINFIYGFSPEWLLTLEAKDDHCKISVSVPILLTVYPQYLLKFYDDGFVAVYKKVDKLAADKLNLL